MTKSDWLTALTAFLAAFLLVPIPAVAGPDLVEVCHHTADAAPDGHEWRHIRVNASSLEKHLAHGDVLAGDTISDTRYLDHDCNVVDTDPQGPPEPSGPPTPGPTQPSEVVLAVAYADIDTTDGGYNPDMDVLVAKLVDGPDSAGDGVPGAGDLIITGEYPVDFELLVEPAPFGPDIHTVTALTPSPAYVCWVQSGSNNFVWSTGDGDFDQYAEWSSDGSLTNLYDARSSGSSGEDLINAQAESPSSPSVNVGPLTRLDDQNQAFIEVEASCP